MSERMTTIVSALVALAILGLGVTAQPTGDPASGRIEALESDLRFQIEMSWRHDGKTRDVRETQLADTLAAWNGSAKSGPDRQLLEKWLRAAIVGTLPGESGEFPPTPTFSERIVEAQKPADAVAKSLPLPPVVEPAQESKPPTPAESNNAQSSTPRDVRLKPGQAYTPPKAKEFRLTPRTPAAGQAAVEPTEPAQQTPAPAPKRGIAAKPIEASPSAATPAVPKEDQPQEEIAPAVAATPAAPPAMIEPKADPPTVAASSNSATPMVDEQPTPSKQQMPERQSPAAQEENSVAPVTVNLAELNAQIRGYHEGIDEINSIVVAKDGKLTEGEVAKLVGQLEQLAAQYQFVRLYYDGLSKGERRFVAAPRSMGETIDMVEAQRAALTAEEEDFLTALEGAVAEDELAKRLKAIAAEVGVNQTDEPQTKPTNNR